MRTAKELIEEARDAAKGDACFQVGFLQACLRSMEFESRWEIESLKRTIREMDLLLRADDSEYRLEHIERARDMNAALGK